MSFSLQTERLSLREMTMADLDFISELLGDADVMRHYPKCHTRAESAEWIERQRIRYERHGHGLWLVVAKATGQAVGQVGLCVRNVDDSDESEIGYLIHRPYWQQGIASEAAEAVRDFAFSELGKRRLISLVRPINIASQRTALKIGMKPEKLVMFADLEHLVFSTHHGEAI